MSDFSTLETQIGANVEYTSLLSPAEQKRQFQWTAKKRQLIVDTLNQLPPIHRAADFGCRAGNEAAYYRDQANIQEMHGFEIAEAPLANARKLGLQTHVWISGENPCPIENDFFDVVIAGDLIEHLVDTDAFVKELRRITRPGGYLILTTPNLAWWWSRLRLVTGKVPHGIGSVSFNHAMDQAVDTKHLRLSVNSEWIHLLTQHHLDLVEIRPYNFPELLRFPFKIIDQAMTNYPNLSHSNLFLLRKPSGG